jgi:hypothetical protein
MRFASSSSTEKLIDQIFLLAQTQLSLTGVWPLYTGSGSGQHQLYALGGKYVLPVSLIRQT